MKLAVSSIAWTNEEEAEVASTLKELGVKYVEIAPTKLWGDPTKATADQIEKYLDFWQGYGIEVVAFQSMLFTNPDMRLFEDEKNRQETLAYLKDFITLAGRMKAKVLVFGSPKNRQRNKLPVAEANTIARSFFSELGDHAKKHGTNFCIEPNPTDYACDFVTDAQQGIELVKQVDNGGFGLHLDIAGMTLANDPIAQSIQDASSLLRHFHISAPFLGVVGPEDGVDNESAAKALNLIGYQGFVSIEMRPGEVGENIGRVKTAVEYAQGIYS